MCIILDGNPGKCTALYKHNKYERFLSLRQYRCDHLSTVKLENSVRKQRFFSVGTRNNNILTDYTTHKKWGQNRAWS